MPRRLGSSKLLVTGLIVALAATSFVVASAATKQAQAASTDCWDEYSITGTTIRRVITPKGVAVSGCTVPTVCLDGWSANGSVRNRLYVPRGRPKSFCSPPPTTTSTQPPTTTTPPPSTTAPTTTAAPTTTTTRPPTTTAAPTTTTTQPPAGAFVETFADGEAWRNRWDLDVHHRADADTPPNPVSSRTWNADHAHNCEGPDLFRTLDAQGDRSQHFYRCAPFGEANAAHVMTSMGDVDGYSTLSMAPLRVFPTIRRVCWDQNVTDAGGRAWTEVLIVPASKIADGDLTHVNPSFVSVDNKTKQHTSQTWGIMVHGQYWGLNVFANGSGASDSSYQAGRDQAGRESRAIRRQHCLTDNGNGTVTVRIDQGASGFYQRNFAGHFPPNARVILEQHAYTPDKDGEACRPRGILTGCRYTWHWDNITVD